MPRLSRSMDTLQPARSIPRSFLHASILARPLCLLLGCSLLRSKRWLCTSHRFFTLQNAFWSLCSSSCGSSHVGIGMERLVSVVAMRHPERSSPRVPWQGSTFWSNVLAAALASSVPKCKADMRLSVTISRRANVRMGRTVCIAMKKGNAVKKVLLPLAYHNCRYWHL